MNALAPDYMAILGTALDRDYVAHLPALMLKGKSPEDDERKNRCRALSAFAIRQICDITPQVAAQSVVDDYDDHGVDAIFYHAPSETIYLVQAKMKASAQFTQEEALAFCQGARKLIKQDFSGFNKNIENRLQEIEDALDNCSHIQLVVVHTGQGISNHAKKALDDLLSDEDHGEERLREVIEFDASHIVNALQSAKAYPRVDVDLLVQKCSMVEVPKTTYFGLILLQDLVKLHDKYEAALYEKNIRTFLGNKTEVNASIQKTLDTNPENFMYLNNGVTALCQIIEPKGTKQAQGGRKRLRIRGLSIINGAQTIASSARFCKDHKNKDISQARVSLTLIGADADGDFGKSVTRARNHQNPVHFTNFAALDEQQERLRRELAHLGIQYTYKAGASDSIFDPKKIRIDEAAQALAMLQPDPRFAVWLKKDANQLLDTASQQYSTLFTSNVTGFQLANAVYFNRYVQARMLSEVTSHYGQERLVYKHGNYALAWILAKQVANQINRTSILDPNKLRVELSRPFDSLRQELFDATEKVTKTAGGYYIKGPLALFRNQSDVLPLLSTVLTAHYALSADPVVAHKSHEYRAGQLYPEALFSYLVSKAPQIGNLS